MTVHMFRIVAEKPSDVDETQANQLVDQWLQTHTPWAEDPTPHRIDLVDDPLSNAPVHFSGDVRFERDIDMVTIREQITTDIAGIASWHRIAYHKCTHDEDSASPCSWDDVTEDGTVPSDVPDFEVTA